jgi:hypothetical protein
MKDGRRPLWTTFHEIPREATLVPAAFMLSTTSTSPTRLLTVKQWVETHAWPPEGGMRHLIFFSKSNGFGAVVRRVGRRVLIDEAAFFAWVEKQGKSDDCNSAIGRRPSSSKGA